MFLDFFARQRKICIELQRLASSRMLEHRIAARQRHRHRPTRDEATLVRVRLKFNQSRGMDDPHFLPGHRSSTKLVVTTGIGVQAGCDERYGSGIESLKKRKCHIKKISGTIIEREHYRTASGTTRAAEVLDQIGTAEGRITIDREEFEVCLEGVTFDEVIAEDRHTHDIASRSMCCYEVWQRSVQETERFRRILSPGLSKCSEESHEPLYGSHACVQVVLAASS